MAVPEAKAAMDRFKTEVASEMGINLKEGYNGDLTSREAGSIAAFASGTTIVEEFLLLAIFSYLHNFRTVFIFQISPCDLSCSYY